MTYYTDDELLGLVRNIGDSKESYEWVAGKIAERFEQKDKQLEWSRRRVNVAAEHIGHQLITDLIEEGY